MLAPIRPRPIIPSSMPEACHVAAPRGTPPAAIWYPASQGPSRSLSVRPDLGGHRCGFRSARRPDPPLTRIPPRNAVTTAPRARSSPLQRADGRDLTVTGPVVAAPPDPAEEPAIENSVTGRAITGQYARAGVRPAAARRRPRRPRRPPRGDGRWPGGGCGGSEPAAGVDAGPRAHPHRPQRREPAAAARGRRARTLGV